MSSGEAANTNDIVLGLTREGLVPMIHCTPGEYDNHYNTDVDHPYDYRRIYIGKYFIKQVTN